MIGIGTSAARVGGFADFATTDHLSADLAGCRAVAVAAASAEIVPHIVVDVRAAAIVGMRTVVTTVAGTDTDGETRAGFSFGSESNQGTYSDREGEDSFLHGNKGGIEVIRHHCNGGITGRRAGPGSYAGLLTSPLRSAYSLPLNQKSRSEISPSDI